MFFFELLLRPRRVRGFSFAPHTKPPRLADRALGVSSITLYGVQVSFCIALRVNS